MDDPFLQPFKVLPLVNPCGSMQSDLAADVPVPCREDGQHELQASNSNKSMILCIWVQVNKS